jgi:hypothetical protein
MISAVALSTKTGTLRLNINSYNWWADLASTPTLPTKASATTAQMADRLKVFTLMYSSLMVVINL